MNSIVDKIRNLTGFKKWLAKFLGLTLIISLTLRFVLPYCHFVLEIPDDNIALFLGILLVISFLFLVIVAFKKKTVHAEPIAIIVSTVIFTSTMVDVLSPVDYKLGSRLYEVKYGDRILYNKWGVKCVDLGHQYSCIALVEDEKNNEIVLCFKKSSVAWGKPQNSEFEVTSYNLSTNKVYNFTFDQYVRKELEERHYMLIDYKLRGNSISQYHNPFSNHYKNYDKIKEEERVKDNDYEIEEKKAVEDDDYYDEEKDDNFDLSSLDDYSSDDDEWVPSAFREEKKSTSVSKSSSEGSGYDPWINYKNGAVIGMMNTGADIYTETSVNAGSVTTTSSTSYCTSVSTGTSTTIQTEKQVCNVCRGTGKDPAPSTVAQYGQITYQYCDICKTTGTPHYHKVCPACQGRP